MVGDDLPVVAANRQVCPTVSEISFGNRYGHATTLQLPLPQHVVGGAQFGTRTGTPPSGGSGDQRSAPGRVNAVFQSSDSSMMVLMSNCGLSEETVTLPLVIGAHLGQHAMDVRDQQRWRRRRLRTRILGVNSQTHKTVR